jgi:hypothetical protein
MSLLLTLGLGGTSTPSPSTGGDTPYMNLLLPTVSVTLGPLYASEVNAAFLRVDGHDHSSGYGKPVNTNGLNINADLSFHGNKAVNLDDVGFNVRTPTAGLTGAVYMSGQDLYCQDGAGNIIQITAAGAVNVGGLGSWTGLSAPAQASYNSVTKKFALQSNTTGPKYGFLAVGDILLYPADPSTSGIYTQLEAAGVTTYTFVFPQAVPPGGSAKQQLISLKGDGTTVIGPTPPTATSFLRMDANGVPYADTVLDGSTLQLLGSGPYTLRVTPSGITNAQIAQNTVTAGNLLTSPVTSVIWSQAGFSTATSPTVSLTPQQSAAYPGKNARPLLVSFGPRYDGVYSQVRAFGSSPNAQIKVTFNIDSAFGAAGSSQYIIDSANAALGTATNMNCWGSFVIPPNTITSSAHTWSVTLQNLSGSNINVDCSLTVTEL